MNTANLAQRTNFIASSDKFENIPFYLTNVNIPGINFSLSEVGGGRQSASLTMAGDTITYNTLNFDLLIDEDFEIYKEVYSIIKKHISVETSTFGDFYFDFFIQINNSKGNPVMKIDYFNCRIESLGDIELSTQDESTESIMSMSLKFDYFTIN